MRGSGSGTAGRLGRGFIPLTFSPGEAFQFDWSHEVVLIDGMTVTVKVAHVRLCHSRMLFVRAYPRERRRWCSTPMTGRSLFQGSCTRGIYDNLWTPPAAR